MSDAPHMAPGGLVVDQVALAIQTLRASTPGHFDALVRIDNRADEAIAPFQFDAARGMLHRKGCRAIPVNAPLLGLAEADPDYMIYACKRCKPVPETSPETKAADRADVMFGLVSLVDQFAGVLKERGRDYRQTADGQHLGAQLQDVYQALGAREKEIVDVVIGALDQVAARLRSLDGGLKQTAAKGED